MTRSDSRFRAPSSQPSGLLGWALLVTCLAAGPWFPVVHAQDEGEGHLSAEELEELGFSFRRGALGEVTELVDEVLDEYPDDAEARLLRARVEYVRCRYDSAIEELEAALGHAQADERTGVQRVAAELFLELGRLDRARELVDLADTSPEGAWLAARVLLENGERDRAFEAARTAAQGLGPETWSSLLARARAERFLGEVRRAARTLVKADELARGGLGTEPSVLVALGELYFEVYGEVENAQSRSHSPAELYKEALDIAPDDEPALLGLFDLHRKNWLRQSRSSGDILEEVLEKRPDSIAGLLRKVSQALDMGSLPEARETLDRLGELAPGRREVAIEKAALAWIEHRRDEAKSELERLAESDPADGRPGLVVGRHLVELYRFSEALEFLEDSVQRDERDWEAWTQLGRARANAGDEAGGLEALTRAAEVAAGRQDAWRDNMQLVLERMNDRFLPVDGDELSFAWQPDADAVLRTYLIPFYENSRQELAERYGFTPDPVRIEVFRRWEDFSVRSTGFQGFPALGVCFGPVVTAVSPLAEPLRGSFSWARTSYHEFTHVIHLGISHNRCPRWITEGIATWEEGERNPSWWRNMRRDLVDARANGAIFPVRKLNGAFRTNRILFAYYQSGLLVQMLVRDHGFQSMVRILEAFDQGADLDKALRDVFRRRPEDLDRDFAAYVDEFLADLAIEPIWQPDTIFKKRFSLSRKAPEDEAQRRAWQLDWVTVAWGFHQQEKPIDRDEALRLATSAGKLPARGLFLRGEMKYGDGDVKGAKRDYEAGLALGAEDFRVRMILGELAKVEGENERAKEHYLAAEKAFPGFATSQLAAELRLASLLEADGDLEGAMEARKRWLGYNAGELELRGQLATWLLSEGRHEEARAFFAESNEVDPFRRSLHLGWGRSLAALGRWQEAEREFRVALLVPAELDADKSGGAAPFGLRVDDFGDAAAMLQYSSERFDESTSELHARHAEALLKLGREDEAKVAADAALALDPKQSIAREVLDRITSGG